MTVMSIIKIAGIKETTYDFPFINKYIIPIHNAIAAFDWLAQEKYLHLIHKFTIELWYTLSKKEDNNK